MLEKNYPKWDWEVGTVADGALDHRVSYIVIRLCPRKLVTPGRFAI